MDAKLSTLNRPYEVQLRKQTLEVVLPTIVAVLAAAFSPYTIYLRLPVALLLAFAGIYTLIHRSTSLTLDYASLPSTYPTPLPPPPPPPIEGEPPAFESAEWMNGVLKEVWPTIDRKLFVAIIDLMEDAMLEASPGIITSCRITSLSPGLHPVSVLGLRILPSSRTTPFQHYHKSPAGRKADAEREKDDVKITSAYADPSIPEPSPWAADPNDQGEAKKSANMSDSSSGGGGGGGVGGRNGDETGSGFVGPQPKAADGGEKQHEKNSDEQGAIPGSFVELEIEFGYRRAVKLEGQGEGGRGHGFGGKAEENNDEGEVRAESTKKDGEKVKQVSPEEATENINFVAYMSIGASKILTVPVPVLISVTHLRGAAYVRLQLIPEPPFVKSVAFGFREMPEVGIAAHPLKGPLDVMTLPLLRSFIMKAMQSVVEGFVLPRHYAIDVRKVILGGDVAMKTRTVGLFCLVLHRARSLPASDPGLHSLKLGSSKNREREGDGDDGTEGKGRTRAEGKSDPFVQVGWAGMGKTLYKTRIVPASLDPVWEEMCFIRVPQEPIEDEQKLRLTVMDHDRFNPNDTLGYLDLPVAYLAAHPGEWQNHKQGKLHRFKAEKEEKDDGGDERGELEFSVAYFPLAEKLLSHQGGDGSGISSTDKANDDDKKDVPSDGDEGEGEGKPTDELDFEERGKEDDESHERKKKARMKRLDEMINGKHPAPPSHLSGILSFQIQQIQDLKLPSKHAGTLRSVGRAVLKPGMGGASKGSLPSSYVEAFVNEEMVFKTRLKPFSNAPYYNAGSEVFIRDWKQGTVTFAAMDYRERDHDTLAGYVRLELASLLRKECQVTKWYPLVGGEGSGRLRASIMFKPLAISIPRGLREWSIGTIQILSAELKGVEVEKSAKISFQLGEATCSTKAPDSGDQEGPVSFDLSRPLYLPVLSRLSPVEVRLSQGGALSKKSAAGFGIFYMNEIVRGENELEVQLSEERPRIVPNVGKLPSLLKDTPSDKPPKEDESSIASPNRPDSPSTRPSQSHRVSFNAANRSAVPGNGLPAYLASTVSTDNSSSPLNSSPTDPSTSSHLHSIGTAIPTDLYTSAPNNHDAASPSSRTLFLRIRWIPGVSAHHKDIVMSSSSASRASYQIYLHQQDHEARLRREKKEAKQVGGDLGMGALQSPGGGGEGMEEWESDSEAGQDGRLEGEVEEKAEIEAKGDGKRRRKGGTMRWLGHAATVATKKLKQSKTHHLSDEKPELEIQSAL